LVGGHGIVTDYNHRHPKRLPDSAAPPLVDPLRRQLLQGLSMLPATVVLGHAADAWAISNRVSIAVRNGVREIHSNAIPDHATGQFPNPHNPNSISEQDINFQVTASPTRAGRFQIAQWWNFGVAVNGVPFEPFTAEFWDRDRNWNYDAISGFVDLGLDNNGAHVQPGGKYHYHGWPTGLIKQWSPDNHSPIIGWAADGFPIYAAVGFADPNGGGPLKKMRSGWRVKQGARDGGPGGSFDGRFFQDWEWGDGLGDLDQANGRECVTPDFPDGTYAYFLTEEWPVVPRYFAGEPDRSFKVGPGNGPGPGGPGGPGGPRGFGGPDGPGGHRRPPPGGGFGPPPGGRPPWPPR
jgi:hypothetical protein